MTFLFLIDFVYFVISAPPFSLKTNKRPVVQFLFDLAFSLMFCEDVFSTNANDYNVISINNFVYNILLLEK